MKGYGSKLDLHIIDKAFSFYNLDEKYKSQAYSCVQEILNNDCLKNKIFEIYNILFVSSSDQFRKLWEIKENEALFGKYAPPFVTNLIVLLGMPFHEAKMKEMGFDRLQIKLHKARVKECFMNDLEKRGYKGIRISQMLWAAYFMNCRIVEIGILQYEYDSSIDKIKIHIPRMPKLEFDKVKRSLLDSKRKIKKYFHFVDKQYICNSWLLSKQLSPILDDESNIKKFQALFRIKDGKDCVEDILNFVYNLKICESLDQLPENTYLQKKIKIELIKGTNFKLGCGELI